MTANQLIRGSLRLLGVLAQGQNPAASESEDALEALNAMLSSWSAEGLLINAVTREDFTLAAATASRTMGVGGNFNTSRPAKITSVALKLNDQEYLMDLVGPNEWAGISNKTLQGLPTKCFLSGTSPLETLNFWPVPSAPYSVTVQSEKPLSSVTLATTLELPPGYERALRYNLAIEVAPEYGKTASAEIVGIAQNSKAIISRANIREDLMESDVLQVTGPRGFFDINSGGYV